MLQAPGLWSWREEQFIIDLEKQIIELCFQNGYNVIIDNTHLPQKTFNRLFIYLQQYVKVIDTQDFRDVPLETCLERNKLRENPVREEWILNMYDKHVKSLI